MPSSHSYYQGPVGLDMTRTGGGCSLRGQKRSRIVQRIYVVSRSNSMQLAIKQIRYSVGVGPIGKIANNPPKVGKAMDYVAAPSLPPLELPRSSQLLCKRLIH